MYIPVYIEREFIKYHYCYEYNNNNVHVLHYA